MLKRQRTSSTRPIRGLAIAVMNSLPDKHLRDIKIQEAVSMFQETGDDDDFAIICDLYDPMRYRHRWYASYGNLFDSDDDFDGQMWECFLRACSRYERGYTLNPLYFQILKTTFANIIKHRQAGMRNPQVRCPICDKMVAPLQTHIINGHPELMTLVLRDYGVNVTDMSICPICDDKPPIMLNDEKSKMKHFRSRHSSLLFSKFMSLHPDHHTAITDPAPPIGSLIRDNGDDDDGFGIDDLGVGPIFNVNPNRDGQYTNNIIRLLGDDCLTECQRVVLETVVYDGVETPPLPDRLCKICHETRGDCPRDDGFRLNRQSYCDELSYLRDIIMDHIPDVG